MNCIAIDDEPLALDIICNYIGRCGNLTLKQTCTDAISAQNYLAENPVDLVFLDIEMPELNGMELFRSIANPPMVIFSTAYSQYAVEGFSLKAIDYLLKPVEFERFKEAVNKAHVYYQYVVNAQVPNYLMVKANYQTYKIPFDDILYLEGFDDYVKVHTVNAKYPIMTLGSLKKIMQQLPQSKFQRVHRSFIVSLNKIDSFQKSTLVLVNGEALSIGETYRKSFRKHLSEL